MCSQGHGWRRSRRLVCARPREDAALCCSALLGDAQRCSVCVCVPCAQPPHNSAHNSPGGRALSVIVLKPTQATYMFSHASSHISLTGFSPSLAQDLYSHRFALCLSISPQLHLADFYCCCLKNPFCECLLWINDLLHGLGRG